MTIQPFGDYLHDTLGKLTQADLLAAKCGQGQTLEAFLGEHVKRCGEGREIAAMIWEYLNSNGFREEVNRRVPPPTDVESEEQFNQRASGEIRQILESRYPVSRTNA